MSGIAGRIRFDRCRTRVGALLDASAEMSVVEHEIGTYQLDREEQAALWLWARFERLAHGGCDYAHSSRRLNDELAKLRGQQLGACAICGRPVYFEENFTRLRGHVIHVSCPPGPTSTRSTLVSKSS